ncbi:MAG TPA: FadR/GntR family transcriptional regulator [Candidatus Dormibacteraeota bacterium]|nr:FadR/GntR family transcriptional regulator [Candidatus Dormibacteraeota bacterium]
MASGSVGADQIQPVRRRRLPKQVADGLRGLLVTGAYKPGDRLPTESELARRFGVGRNTLREAVGQLEMLGVIEVLQGGGTFVRSPDAGRVAEPFRVVMALSSSSTRQVLEFRRVLEPGIAALAAEKATPEQIARLEELLDRKVALQRRSRATAVLQTDLDYHLALAEATNNPLIQDVARALLGLLREFRLRLGRQASFSDELTACERRVLQAVAARDPALAMEAMQEHMALLNSFIPEDD